MTGTQCPMQEQDKKALSARNEEQLSSFHIYQTLFCFFLKLML